MQEAGGCLGLDKSTAATGRAATRRSACVMQPPASHRDARMWAELGLDLSAVCVRGMKRSDAVAKVHGKPESLRRRRNGYPSVFFVPHLTHGPECPGSSSFNLCIVRGTPHGFRGLRVFRVP